MYKIALLTQYIIVVDSQLIFVKSCELSFPLKSPHPREKLTKYVCVWRTIRLLLHFKTLSDPRSNSLRLCACVNVNY